MRLIVCEQGSPEWHQARAGCITASMFKVARERIGGLTVQQQIYIDAVKSGQTLIEACATAGYKTKPKAEAIDRALSGHPVGDYSGAAKTYAFRLAIERISGQPLDEGFETWQMKRGHELEPAARAMHEAMSGVLVDRAGFVATDDGWFGASADGLIDHDGGSEYKCLVSPEALRDVLLLEDLSEYMDQIQGCLWVTGRKWWHFGLYCPALEPIGREFFWREIARDENYIEALEADLIKFNELVESYKGFILNVQPSANLLKAA